MATPWVRSVTLRSVRTPASPRTWTRAAAIPHSSLITALNKAQQALGPRTSLDGLAVGVRLTMPGLKVVTQPNQSRFVIYSVPNDIAAGFDCQSRQTPGDGRKARREYGKYFGATFFINVPGGKDHSVALLWAQQDGYWKIVSWQAEPEGDDAPQLSEPPTVDAAAPRSPADSHAGRCRSRISRQLADPKRLRRGFSLSLTRRVRLLRPGPFRRPAGSRLCRRRRPPDPRRARARRHRRRQGEES